MEGEILKNKKIKNLLKFQFKVYIINLLLATLGKFINHKIAAIVISVMHSFELEFYIEGVAHIK